MKQKVVAFAIILLWMIPVGSRQPLTPQNLSFQNLSSHVQITKSIQVGTEQNDSFIDVQHDRDNNIYVVGSFGLEQGHTEARAIIRKYTPTGEQIWEQQFNSNLEDVATNLVLTKDNNLFVVGYTHSSFEATDTLLKTDSLGNVDIFFAKLNSQDGQVLWFKQFGSPGNDFPRAITFDEDDNLYLVGRTDGNMTNHTDVGDYDGFILKLNARGERLWVDQFGTDRFDVGVSVEIMKDRVYVLSRMSISSDRNRAQAVLTSYSLTGNRGSDYVLDLIDRHGDLYYSTVHDVLYIAVKGHKCSHRDCRSNKSLVSLYEMKNEEAPELRDTVFLSDWGGRFAFHPVTLLEDSKANLYLAASAFQRLEQNDHTLENQDIFLRKYNSNLDVLWSEQFGTTEGENLDQISFSTDGTLVMVGTSRGSFGGGNLGMGDAYMLLADVGQLDNE